MKKSRKTHKPGRNKEIATAILKGKTLAFQADKFDVSAERIRKLTLSNCCTTNRTAYPGHGIIINKNRKLFDAWDKQDEVDAWECQRVKRIENIQGNENPFVKQACVREDLW